MWRRRETSRADLPEVVGIRDQAEDRNVIAQALVALGPRTRSVIVLRHWLGYDVAEWGNLLGCSEGTVKSQTARGLARLRDLLNDDLQTTGSIR